jgi:hypothetical protein
MKVNTNELTRAALNWAVATALGRGPKYNMYSHGRTWHGWWLAGPGHEYEPMPSYSTDWAHGGPLIEREDCWPSRYYGAAQSRGKVYQASAYNGSSAYAQGPTPLIAAMRCFVASKLGDEIEIPEELI